MPQNAAQTPVERPSSSTGSDDLLHVVLTITETWNGCESVTWTARSGRHVVASVRVPMQHGVVDSDVLRRAIAERYGLGDWSEYHKRITYDRKRSDAHRVVPRIMRIRLRESQPI